MIYGMIFVSALYCTWKIIKRVISKSTTI